MPEPLFPGADIETAIDRAYVREARAAGGDQFADLATRMSGLNCGMNVVLVLSCICRLLACGILVPGLPR